MASAEVKCANCCYRFFLFNKKYGLLYTIFDVKVKILLFKFLIVLIRQERLSKITKEQLLRYLLKKINNRIDFKLLCAGGDSRILKTRIYTKFHKNPKMFLI